MTDTDDLLDDDLELAHLNSSTSILLDEELFLLTAAEAAGDHGDTKYLEVPDFEDDISLLLAAEEGVKLTEEEEFEDDLEAVEELKKEQKEKWDREGVVVRGNSLGKRDLEFVIGQDNNRRKVRRERNQRAYLRQREREVSRSSSLPPGGLKCMGVERGGQLANLLIWGL